MAPDTSESATPLRNRQHLVQLLNALHRDAVDGKSAELWLRTEDGVVMQVQAFLNAARNVGFKLNGSIWSKSKILVSAGY